MSAIIKMGNKTPVEALAPKIKASAGTTIIETPGTPTFDIPISIPQAMMMAHSSAFICSEESSSIPII
jgi:hypothetical protein